MMKLSSILILLLSCSGVPALGQTISGRPSDGPANAAKVIVVIGDSIASGYGVRKEEGFPEQLEKLLNEKKRPDVGGVIKVINGGTPGSLSAGAASRLKWFLRARPSILIIELGGNDALQGTPVPNIKSNLAELIDQAQKNHLSVLLVGMQVYSNLGSSYTTRFKQMYFDLAKQKKVALMPFLLEGVALKPELNQADLKHPNAKGHAVIAQKMAPYVEKLL
jgi:acyl-CoA thioesterase-1